MNWAKLLYVIHREFTDSVDLLDIILEVDPLEI